HFRAITVKLSQGAKPGGGGVLPKAKITAEIARIRNIPRDKDCHSPNRFKEFRDVASMFDWIRNLQDETGKPVGIKFCLGDRAFMLSMGCIQAMQCHTNHCPTGITTHSRWLQAGLDPTEKGVRVANYALNIRKELMLLVRSMGLRSPSEITRHHVFVNTGEG